MPDNYAELWHQHNHMNLPEYQRGYKELQGHSVRREDLPAILQGYRARNHHFSAALHSGDHDGVRMYRVPLRWHLLIHSCVAAYATTAEEPSEEDIKYSDWCGFDSRFKKTEFIITGQVKF